MAALPGRARAVAVRWVRMIELSRYEAILLTLFACTSTSLFAETNCALTGSSSLMVEGRAMLKLSDVQGCKDVRYEIIPSLIIEGEPAVRLAPTGNIKCGVGGSTSVTAGGGAVTRIGDVVCPE